MRDFALALNAQKITDLLAGRPVEREANGATFRIVLEPNVMYVDVLAALQANQEFLSASRELPDPAAAALAAFMAENNLTPAQVAAMASGGGG